MCKAYHDDNRKPFFQSTVERLVLRHGARLQLSKSLGVVAPIIASQNDHPGPVYGKLDLCPDGSSYTFRRLVYQQSACILISYTTSPSGYHWSGRRSNRAKT